MSGFGVVFVEVIGDLRASEGRKMSKRGREGRSFEASGHDPASRLKQDGFEVSSGGVGGGAPLSIGTSRLSFLPPSYDTRLDSTGMPEAWLNAIQMCKRDGACARAAQRKEERTTYANES